LFEVPSQMVIIIAATRMHRSLLDFTSGPSDVYDHLSFLSFFPLSAADDILGSMRLPK